MALQRNLSPMPEGRYWIDLFEPLAEGRPDARTSFQTWRNTEGKNKVRVETIEEFTRAQGNGKARQFVIFRVLEPVMGFPSKDVGFPEIIKLGREQPPIEQSPIKTSEDTVHDDESAEEPSSGTQAVKVLVVVGVAVGAVIGGALLWAWFEEHRAPRGLSAAKSAAA
jgi:hypothetical protein